MQQTENYQLSLWNREDRILMGIYREEEETDSAAPASCSKLSPERAGTPENFAGAT